MAKLPQGWNTSLAKELSSRATDPAEKNIREHFAREQNRQSIMQAETSGLFLDFSKNSISLDTFNALLGLAQSADFHTWRERFFAGEKINHTENRAVLHSALRGGTNPEIQVDGAPINQKVEHELDRIKAFARKLHSAEWLGRTNQPITDVVNIGIGGSDLGPKMVVRALKHHHIGHLNFHFLSNIDPSQSEHLLARLDPATTLFIVSSKSFSTQETLSNAYNARNWFLSNGGTESDIPQHFVAVSTNTEKVEAFGIDKTNMFEFWDWVGGRYSCWSAIGLPILLAIGEQGFDAFLAGAKAMDHHFQAAPLEKNIPFILAILGIWYINFLGAKTHAILPYDEALGDLPAYLQQADMESNGKSTDRSGKPVDYDAGPILWGASGINGQHAFYQLLHQGTHLVPADFIVSIRSKQRPQTHHNILLANCFAQTEALMIGRDENLIADDPMRAYKRFPGNRPTNTLIMDELTPFNLGQLIAAYEHKIFTQGVLWNINSYDQWGVELGKQLAKVIEAEIQNETDLTLHDASTQALIERARSSK